MARCPVVASGAHVDAMTRLICWLIVCLATAAPAARCWADGGAVRAIEQCGPFQLSVFTSPNPLVAGLADISVLVQQADTLAAVPAAHVEITIAPRGHAGAGLTLPATRAAATNKLLLAALIELEPGWYDVRVDCQDGGSRGVLDFPLEVGRPPPQLAALWPWFSWPVVPVFLFGLHQILSRRRPAGG